MAIVPTKYFLTASLMCLTLSSLGFASDPTEQCIEPIAAVAKSTLSEDEIKQLDLSSPLLSKHAESGNLEAISQLGYCYLKGIGGPQNGKLAFKYLTQGVKGGNPECMSLLAYCLESGIGCAATEQNKRLAHVWYQKAIDGGYIHALDELGYLFENSIGCANSAENKRKALELYTRGAHEGDADSACSLANCLQQGIGCEPTQDNKALALEWLKDAASAGHRDSMLGLAVSIERGIGCDYPDKYEQAVFWYEKAAKAGSDQAMNNLAFCLDNGLGCEQDKPRAKLLWAMAGELGCSFAFANLGGRYFLDKNYKMALYYLEKISVELKLNSLVGFIYFREKNYERALVNYERALEVNERGTSPALIQYLKSKVADAKKASRMSKGANVNLAQKGAKEAQLQSLKSKQQKSVDLYKQLQVQLKSLNSTEDFDAAKELTLMNKMFQMASTGMEDFDTSKKLERATKLLEFLRNIEGKILLHEQSEESARTVSKLTMRPTGISNNFAFEVEAKTDSSMKKEVKEAAARSQADEKDRKHAHHTRKHDKPTTQKAKDAKRKPSPETVKPEVVKGPFADMLKPVKKTQAQLNDTCWNNVYKIRDTLRTATSLDNARGLLEALQGDFDFKEVTPAYAGIPNADLVFQMRINQQYRVLIAFEKVTEQVYEQGPNGENNNNPVEQVTYKLYGDTIYIDDPHKG